MLYYQRTGGASAALLTDSDPHTIRVPRLSELAAAAPPSSYPPVIGASLKLFTGALISDVAPHCLPRSFLSPCGVRAAPLSVPWQPRSPWGSFPLWLLFQHRFCCPPSSWGGAPLIPTVLQNPTPPLSPPPANRDATYYGVAPLCAASAGASLARFASRYLPQHKLFQQSLLQQGQDGGAEVTRVWAGSRRAAHRK